jgi:hypothetical protein
MGQDFFHSMHEIERFLAHRPENLKEIVFGLRDLVAEIAPHATEKIQWKGLSYFDATRGGVVKGGICQIEIHADHVRLSFIHGAFLDDPHGLLEGDRLSKRYVCLENFQYAPWERLEELIRVAAKFDPVEFWKGRQE